MSDTATPPGTGEAPKAAPEPTADELFEARMKEWKTRWAKMRTEFEQELDELKLKAHLGREDAKDEWDRMESRFRAFSKDIDEKSDDVEDIVEEKLKAISAELKDGFERLRKLF
jgi:N-acyl-D-aspartate/D-glutamate deacylase